MRSMDRFEPPECGPEEHHDDERGYLEDSIHLTERIARLQGARLRAEQAINAGEVPELDGVADELGIEAVR